MIENTKMYNTSTLSGNIATEQQQVEGQEQLQLEECGNDDSNHSIYNVKEQENQNQSFYQKEKKSDQQNDDENNGANAGNSPGGGDDREEGEIVDEFEDIISSDEELTMIQRIEELEAKNAELEKIANISGIYDYDYPIDRYQKSNVIVYNHDHEDDNYDIDENDCRSSLYIPSKTKRLIIKSKVFPSTPPPPPSPPPQTTVSDRDVKHRHHNHHHHHHHHHGHHHEQLNPPYTYEEELDRRDYISPSPELILPKHRKRKRKYQKISRSRSKKSKSDKRKKKSRHTSPIKSSDDDGNDKEFILNRDELRMALKRDITSVGYRRTPTMVETTKRNVQERLKITVDKNENSKSGDDRVIRTIDLVSDDTDDGIDNINVRGKDIIHIRDEDENDEDNEKLNFVAEISGEEDDDDNDSASLEEQELRLIALKSAVVKKHLARKRRRQSDDERPYSPSDNFVGIYNRCYNGGDKDFYSISSPSANVLDTPPPLNTIENDESSLLNDNIMDISPISSPDLNNCDNLNYRNETAIDCVLKPVDMEIVNSDSSNSPSPIFERQHNYNWMPIQHIPLSNANTQQKQEQDQQQKYTICSPKAIKPMQQIRIESNVPLPQSSLKHSQQHQNQDSFSSISLQQVQQIRNIEADDNEKLLIRTSPSLDSMVGRELDKGSVNDNDYSDDDDDEEESALRALLLAKMKSAMVAKQQQQQKIANDQNEKENEPDERDDSNQLVISKNLYEPPIYNNKFRVPENEESSSSSLDIGTLRDLSLVSMNINKKHQLQTKSVNKSEFVLKEAVKRLKNKGDQQQNLKFSEGEEKENSDKSTNQLSLQLTDNNNLQVDVIGPENCKFEDADVENMINLLGKVQFDGVKLIHDIITKQQQTEIAHNSTDSQNVIENAAVQVGSNKMNKVQSGERRMEIVNKELNLKENKNDNNKAIQKVPSIKTKVIENEIQKIPPLSDSSLSLEDNKKEQNAHQQQLMKIAQLNRNIKVINDQQKSLKKLATAAIEKTKNLSNAPSTSALSSSTLSSLSSSVANSNLNIIRTINNNSRKITKTRTKIINNNTNTHLIKNRNIIKTVLNDNSQKDDILSVTAKTNTINPSSLSSAASIATRLVTKPEIPKVQRIIIRLGESSSSESESESESDDDGNKEINNQNYFDGNDDNASPMSLQLDSPAYSPMPSIQQHTLDTIDSGNSIDLNIKTEKTVVNDVFQAKLDEFLKSARTKVEKIKQESTTTTATTSTTTPTKVSSLKTVATKTPAAVRHLPHSSQLEYQKLISRMKILEKQKQARNAKKANNNKENVKVTIKNDQIVNAKTDEPTDLASTATTTSTRTTTAVAVTSTETVITTTVPTTLTTTKVTTTKVSSSLNEVQHSSEKSTNISGGNQKEKLIKKVLIKNASNVPPNENSLSHVHDDNDDNKKNLNVNIEDNVTKNVELEKEKPDEENSLENNQVETTSNEKTQQSLNKKSIDVQESVKKSKESSKLSLPSSSTEKIGGHQQKSTSLNKKNDVKSEKDDSSCSKRLQPVKKSKTKNEVELLGKYENDLKKNSCNLLNHISSTIDLVFNARKEKFHKLLLQQKYEKLKSQLKLIENELDTQNRKLSKIYPQITDSYKEIVDLKTKCNNLSKTATDLGKSVHGNNYGLKYEEKTLIYEKSKQLLNEMKGLKSLNISDLKEKIALKWIITNKNVQEKSENEEKNSTSNIGKVSECAIDHEVVEGRRDENELKSSTEKESLSRDGSGSNSSLKENEIPQSDENFVVDDGKQEELMESIGNQKEIHSNQVPKMIVEGDSLRDAQNILKDTNSNVKDKVDETSIDQKENNEMDSSELESSIMKNRNCGETIMLTSGNEDKQNMEISSGGWIGGNGETRKENVDEEMKEISSHTEIRTELMKAYVSPLEHIQQDRAIDDPNGIICPYQLMGQCDDKECKFSHLQS